MLAVWGQSRSTFYARQRRTRQPVVPRRRGPKTKYTDAELLDNIRALLACSPFHGEGHRKIWPRICEKFCANPCFLVRSPFCRGATFPRPLALLILDAAGSGHRLGDALTGGLCAVLLTAMLAGVPKAERRAKTIREGWRLAERRRTHGTVLAQNPRQSSLRGCSRLPALHLGGQPIAHRRPKVTISGFVRLGLVASGLTILIAPVG